MLTKIKRVKCLMDYPKFPLRTYNAIKDEEEFFNPVSFANHILTVKAKSFKGHVTLLSSELPKLMKTINIDSLIFLADTKTSWLHQINDYKPVKEATEFLINNKIGKKFNGALRVNIASLPIFIKHLSWLMRCNASLSYIYFSDEQQNFIATICQYGNLHFNTLNENADVVLKTAIFKSAFKYLETNNCHEQYGKNAIIGRRIIV